MSEDYAEFEIHCNGSFEAGTCGPREDAWRDILHYAAQYAQDGKVEIYEVTRTLVTRPLPPEPKLEDEHTVPFD